MLSQHGMQAVSAALLNSGKPRLGGGRSRGRSRGPGRSRNRRLCGGRCRCLRNKILWSRVVNHQDFIYSSCFTMGIINVYSFRLLNTARYSDSRQDLHDVSAAQDAPRWRRMQHCQCSR